MKEKEAKKQNISINEIISAKSSSKKVKEAYKKRKLAEKEKKAEEEVAQAKALVEVRK